MNSSMNRLILVKDAPEIGLKGKNRNRFRQRLIQNLLRSAELPADRARDEPGRVYLHVSAEEMDGALDALGRVFGAHSFAPAYRTEPNLDAAGEACLRIAESTRLENASFGVRVKRADRSFPVSSNEAERRLGALLLNRFPSWRVDLTAPDLWAHVEFRHGSAYAYSSLDERAGPGGMPVGASGKALALLSGGIDSPAAAWMAMRRGLSVDAVHFHSFPFTGEKAKEKCLNLARVLSRWKTLPVNAYVLPFAETQTAVAQKVDQSLWTLVFRRMMDRAALRLMKARRYRALVTGDNLGQVASQTVENLAAMDAAVDMLRLRPLIAYDKVDTIALARRIGTYEISILPYEDCCTAFAPKQPKTKATARALEQAEAALPVEALTDACVNGAQLYRVRPDSVEEADAPDLKNA